MDQHGRNTVGIDAASSYDSPSGRGTTLACGGRDVLGVTAAAGRPYHAGRLAQLVLAPNARGALPAGQPRVDDHPVANPHTRDLAPKLHHVAGGVPSQHVGPIQRQPRPANSRAGEQVQPVHAAGPDAHQDVVRPGYRLRQLAEGQRLDASVPGYVYSLQTATSSRCGMPAFAAQPPASGLTLSQKRSMLTSI